MILRDPSLRDVLLRIDSLPWNGDRIQTPRPYRHPYSGVLSDETLLEVPTPG